MDDSETIQSSIERKSGRHSNPQELLEILQDTAARLQNNAKYKQCVKVLTQAISLQIEVYGKDSNQVKDEGTKLIKMCNKLAVKMLKIGRFDDCIEFIGNALSLTGQSYLPGLISLRIVTLNNASSCHRRLGDMKKALSYAQEALTTGLNAEKDDSLACSHLNICCVYSQNGDHEVALHHAMDALAAANNAVRSSKSDESLLTVELDVHDPQRKQKLATLCIAYHNTGVELEHLKRYEECLEKYEKALQISEMFLPENREMAASFRQSYKAAKLIASEYNIVHGRPKIPQKIVQHSKSSTGLSKRKNKKHNFRSAQNLHTKNKRPLSAGLLRQQKTNNKSSDTIKAISYSFTNETKQLPVDGVLPPVKRSSSEENLVESKDDGTLEIPKGSTTVLLSSAPSSQDQLNEYRSREGELEKKLAMMQRRVAQLEAKLDPIENGSTIADSILFNKKLEEIHERRQRTLVTTMSNTTKPKRRIKRRPQSASLTRRKIGSKSSSNISSAKLSRTGMLITGPGITGG